MMMIMMMMTRIQNFDSIHRATYILFCCHRRHSGLLSLVAALDVADHSGDTVSPTLVAVDADDNSGR